MDSGYLEKDETLQDVYDATSSLNPDQLIWVMDELLKHQVRRV